MDIAASPSDRSRPASLWWGVPWPSDDDLQAEADTAWAIEVGLIDRGGFEARSFEGERFAPEVGLIDRGGFDVRGFEGERLDIEMPAPFNPAASAYADLAAPAPFYPATCASSGPAPSALSDPVPSGSVPSGSVPSDPASSGPAPSALSEPATPTSSEPATPTSSDRATLAPSDPVTLLDELEHHVRERHRAAAAEYRLIRRLLYDAVVDPVPWVGPDPALDAAWSDTRGRTMAAVRRDRRDLAERAAVAEIAVRLRLSEQTVRTRAAHAETLQMRCPEVWAAFAEGMISERHAVESARLATSLPDEVAGEPVASTPPDSALPADEPTTSPDEVDVPSRELSPDAEPGSPNAPDALVTGAGAESDERASWKAFDEGALDRALRLPPARFTVAARALRERVHSESLEARHRRAARDRGVWLTPELDGMATLTALLPADRAHDALTRVDRIARQLRAAPDEDRALSELRADVFADLLTVSGSGDAGSTPPDATGAGAGAGAADSRGAVSPVPASPTPRTNRRATIVVTVPALTLLGAGAGAGAGAEPAVLDGYGPINLDTARRLAGEATSWVRVLTHPLTAVPLALDRSTYRVPTALRRWLGVTSPTCVFPGCGRAARECDLDHLRAWAEGGVTDDDNLAPECRHHHRLRHETRWHPSRDPDTGDLRWTSPLGADFAEDPPPF
ncbi:MULTISPECIES: DUF222 domain-containing protein [Microbacterium]|uniref:DUF222 domain-containing protein n=1 Tax=Microbacterium TaxID=33882 RepID=UPI002785BEAA|nr:MULTISPECIES: DUF222 domain-containing protein [Microbacterium]MDQ1083586.1 hypothetical protein [Microbacterium sp. SORGH_AS_0344]MDQ1171138.1 hypothetical protein [Microbacterium proteolyticum]